MNIATNIIDHQSILQRCIKKTSTFAFSALFFSLSLSSCSDESKVEEPHPGLGLNESKYYISLEVSVPDETGTRSYTDNGNDSNSNDFFESATNKESSLTSATIYLCKENDVVVSFEATEENVLSFSNSSKRLQVEVTEEDLHKMTYLVGQDVKLYVVGNAKETSLKHDFSSTNNDVTTFKLPGDVTFSLESDKTVEDDPIGKFGSDGKIMPLINAKEFPITALKNLSGSSSEDKLKAVKGLFSGITNLWWNVTPTLDLERAVARIEFKDADRTAGSTMEELESYVYPINDMTVKLKLHSMQPFNVNPQSYLFRHTWAGSTIEADLTKTTADLFGTEKDNSTDNKKYNWVATPDWDKSSGKWSKSTTVYLNKLNIDTQAYTIDGNGKGVVTIGELLKNFEEGYTGYMPWCYVTENTLPSTNLMAEADENKNALIATLATGVAFKFEILDIENSPLTYSATKVKYPAEITNSINNTEDGEEIITITDNKNRWIDVIPEENSDGGKHYYLTYVAPIVHNAPSGSSSTNPAPMFYGVVRNNTYQMRINSIGGIPLPQEPNSFFLSLEIRVLAWAKRDIHVTWW